MTDTTRRQGFSAAKYDITGIYARLDEIDLALTLAGEGTKPLSAADQDALRVERTTLQEQLVEAFGLPAKPSGARIHRQDDTQ